MIVICDSANKTLPIFTLAKLKIVFQKYKNKGKIESFDKVA